MKANISGSQYYVSPNTKPMANAIHQPVLFHCVAAMKYVYSIRDSSNNVCGGENHILLLCVNDND